MVTKFNSMSKMATTEPSVNEARMKKGGKAKKMAEGGKADRWDGFRKAPPV